MNKKLRSILETAQRSDIYIYIYLYLSLYIYIFYLLDEQM